MHTLVGTRHLIVLALRRDRLILPVWIVALGLMPAVAANAYEELYPTMAARAPLTGTIGDNPALAVLFGPAFDLSTAGGFTAWRMLGILSLFIALMVIFTVTRHTRAEEDSGRHELLASGVIGRYAPLTAAVLVAGGTSGLIGLIAMSSLAGLGLPLAGAIAFGKALAGVGWVFTGVAAVSAQLVPYARTANAIACGVLGTTFLLRGLGDAGPDASWLHWLSPLGWAQQLRPFTGERWWVLALPLAGLIATLAVAFALLRVRDAGAGILPDRPGRATAAAGLRSPFALAWRLQRGALIGWAAGMTIAGIAFGAVAIGVGELIIDNPQMREIFERMGGSTLVIDSFLAQIAGIFGMVAALYGVQATLRLRAEETAVRVEPLLATRVGRVRLALSHLVFGLLGTGIVLAAAGLGTGLAHGLRVDDVRGYVPAMLGATLSQLPAIWLVVAVAAVLFGLLPRHSSSAWGIAAMLILLTLFGPIFDLDPLLIDASPFSHIPRVPGGDFAAGPLLWIAGIAAVVLFAGLAGFRRRDVG